MATAERPRPAIDTRPGPAPVPEEILRSLGGLDVGLAPPPPIHHARLASDSSTRSDEATAVALKPPTLPPPPFFLTNYTVTMTGVPALVKDAVKGALAASRVDFEFNEAKWKAKCYVYRLAGNAVFTARLYTEPREGGGGGGGGGSPKGGDKFIVELQRRKGDHGVFREAYDAVVAALRAAAHPGQSQLAIADLAALAARGGGGPPPMPGGGDDDPGDVGGPSPRGSVDPKTVVDAFGHLVVMLVSEFDDVASSAAQSIAALSASARVRESLGRCAMDEAAALQKLQASSPMPASPVLGLFKALTSRAVSATASAESRTVCALTLAKCALDAPCARVLFHMGAPWVLLDALARVPVAAPLAALRRECVRAVLHVANALDDGARAALRASGPVGPSGAPIAGAATAGALALRLTQPPLNADVGEFNALASALLSLLQAAGVGGQRGAAAAP